MNLTEDTQAWLRPAGDTDRPAAEQSTVPPPTDEHSGRETGTTANSTDRSRSLDGDPPRPAAGRHRAAD